MWVIDTNILVAYVRASGTLYDTVERNYRLSARAEPCIASVISHGEMWALALKFGWGTPKRERLRELLNGITVVDIVRDDEVLHNAYAEIDHWVHYVQQPRKTVGKNDIWIAALTKVTGWTLLTEDKDFDTMHAAGLIKRHRIDRDGTIDGTVTPRREPG